ncbi:MAG: transposase [Deltaproteobacteria bacterium]|nr:transposase [Deltaproteobacteria bacterium]
MQIWLEWWYVVCELRPACSRTRSFIWLVVTLAGLSIRADLLGVTSIIRALGLHEKYYDRLLDFFHSSSINSDKLAIIWTSLVLRFFPVIPKINGRIILLGDGIKIPKAGKKMPAVKCLHQESENNAKPEYIMGHSCQAVSLVVGAEESAFAVPLSARIHEGLVFSNRCRRKLTDKMVSLVQLVEAGLSFYFVGDAYYACHVVALGIINIGGHLVSRVRCNAVAYEPAPKSTTKHRGRPKFYGKKIRLMSLFSNPNKMSNADSPVYGEKNTVLLYRSMDLIWKPLGRVVRFVAVAHPVRGRCLLMSTDLTVSAIDIIRLYGIRFKIEVSFKNALRVVGAYAYHFWLGAMKPIKRGSGNQYLHCQTEKYRQAVKRKFDAYQRHIQIGLIVQGMLQYLSATYPRLVWKNFGSWLRTIRPGIPPSEMVTAQALRNCFPEFLLSNVKSVPLTKFILKRVDIGRAECLRLTG